MDTSPAVRTSHTSGSIVDPIADKLLISAALISLVENQLRQPGLSLSSSDGSCGDRTALDCGRDVL